MASKSEQRRRRRKRQREAAAATAAQPAEGDASQAVAGDASQPVAAQTPGQRLAKRREDKAEDKRMREWFMSAMGDDEDTAGDDEDGADIPSMLQRALTDSEGGPLEAITAELPALMGEDWSDGENLDRLSRWLDRYSAAIDQVERPGAG